MLLSALSIGSLMLVSELCEGAWEHLAPLLDGRCLLMPLLKAAVTGGSFSAGFWLAADVTGGSSAGSSDALALGSGSGFWLAAAVSGGPSACSAGFSDASVLGTGSEPYSNKTQVASTLLSMQMTGSAMFPMIILLLSVL